MKITIGGKTFEIKKEDLEKESLTLEFDGVLRTQEEEATFIENHKKDARKEGEEIAVKQYREEFGFQGRSIDKLIEAVKAKTLEEAKIEPNEQLKKLQGTLSEKEEALQNAISKTKELESSFVSYKNQSAIDRTLDGLIPENTLLPKEDIKTILRTKMSFDVSENGAVVAKDAQGNVIKNKTTADAMDVKDVLDNFFKDNKATYLKPIEGGRGQGDSGKPGNKQTLEAFMKEQGEKGIKPNSQEFQQELQERVKQGLVDVE